MAADNIIKFLIFEISLRIKTTDGYYVTAYILLQLRITCLVLTKIYQRTDRIKNQIN